MCLARCCDPNRCRSCEASSDVRVGAHRQIQSLILMLSCRDGREHVPGRRPRKLSSIQLEVLSRIAGPLVC